MQGLQTLIQRLRQQRLTIGFAESCTGGLLSSTLTEQPGISDIFLGSVVSYANQVKFDVLGVSREAYLQRGAVSETIAAQMAEGCRRVLKVDCAVAITGIAGPSGGTAEKPVGTVCFAVVGPSFERTALKLFSGSRREIQLQACEFAIEFLLDEMK